jgi:glutamine synthetase
LTVAEVLELIRQKGIEFVDVKIVDLLGTWHHFTLPAEEFGEEVFERGLPFDGSSLRGYRGIEESDMILLPDPETAVVDPFAAHPTLSLTGNVMEPGGRAYRRDPRSVAQRAEEYLRASGIADRAYFGPEVEFYVFDDVRYEIEPHAAFFALDAAEAHWGAGDVGPNLAYRIRPKEGYAPVPPADALHDLRNEMVRNLKAVGIRVERHHHEVGGAGQGEIGFRYDTLTRTADNVLLFKYVLRNTARRHGKTVTFMPKPLYGDNGSGMHTHQSLWQGDRPLFYDEQGYAHLSELARYYIGGILLHGPALLALCNATVNSYRRLVPGYEAPVDLVFSQGNRSAAVRIPIAGVTPASTRIEFRTPDATGNPYLAFAAMLMAGLDGIRRRIDPTAHGFGPLDKNIYELSPAERAAIRSVPGSLEEALRALEADHDFLLAGGVFDEELIATWIQYKREKEIRPTHLRPTPYEFYLYFDI